MQLQERWTFTPTEKDVGDFPIEILVRNESNTVVARGKSLVRVIAKTKRSSPVTLLLSIQSSCVSPSIVRYRLARLRELMGDQLDDPDARFELELALRARS